MAPVDEAAAGRTMQPSTAGVDADRVALMVITALALILKTFAMEEMRVP